MELETMIGENSEPSEPTEQNIGETAGTGGESRCESQ